MVSGDQQCSAVHNMQSMYALGKAPAAASKAGSLDTAGAA
jgi:hypothetical protein